MLLSLTEVTLSFKVRDALLVEQELRFQLVELAPREVQVFTSELGEVVGA